MHNLMKLVALVMILAKLAKLVNDFDIVRMEAQCYDTPVVASDDGEDSETNPTPDAHDAWAWDSADDSR